MNRIILVGFMGSGKTYLGRSLAQQMGLRFYDLDTLVEESTGKTVSAIFSGMGEEAFRQAERESLLRILQEDQLVLSTGGGAPAYRDQMDLMNRSGLTVYLRCHPRTLYERLKNAPEERPLLRGLSGDSLLEYIRSTLDSREAWYNQARLIIQADELNPMSLYESVARDISS